MSLRKFLRQIILYFCTVLYDFISENLSCAKILIIFQWQHETFEIFLFGPGLTSMSPWENNNKVRNAIILQLTNLKTLNLLLVLRIGFD